MGASSSIATIVSMGQQDVMPRAFPWTMLQLSQEEPSRPGFIELAHSSLHHTSSTLNNPRKCLASAKESRSCVVSRPFPMTEGS